MKYSRQNIPPNYYVYAYLRKESNIPYYIGKGKKTRAWEIHYNSITRPKNENKIQILEANLTELGAMAIERRLISWYGRKGIDENGVLLNKTSGGDGTSGFTHSPETRKKMSDKQKGKKGQIPWNKGKKLGPLPKEWRDSISKGNKGKKVNFTPEWREKISKSLAGKKQTPDSIAKRVERIKGHTVSEETRKKISAANTGRKRDPKLVAIHAEKMRGRKQSPEEIAKRSAALKGHEVSKETREKIRLANTGKKHTEETKEKLRAARAKQIPWNKGKKTGPLSEDTKQKLSLSNTGKTHSEETKEKLRQINIGRKHSQETISKISAAKKNPSEETRAKMRASRMAYVEKQKIKLDPNLFNIEE